MEAGFLAEVEALVDRRPSLSRTASQALGYKELLGHLNGEMSLDEALALAITRTRQFAAAKSGGSGATPASSGSTPMTTPRRWSTRRCSA